MLFQTIFKDRFERMPGAWQRFHEVSGVHHYKGAAKVVRGSGAFVWLAAGLLGLPQTSDVVLNMRLEADGDGERWQRRFGNHEFSTRLSPARGEARYCLYESYGPFRFCVELIPEHWVCSLAFEEMVARRVALAGFYRAQKPYTRIYR